MSVCFVVHLLPSDFDQIQPHLKSSIKLVEEHPQLARRSTLRHLHLSCCRDVPRTGALFGLRVSPTARLFLFCLNAHHLPRESTSSCEGSAGLDAFSVSVESAEVWIKPDDAFNNEESFIPLSLVWVAEGRMFSNRCETPFPELD